ncbi:M12 family metallopeptidase [Sinorhizobium fredii]|uniref:M12 family metallopeptidase n=1 Tax=Rhizobium fredii TaxID=380 RepID=UPI003517A0F4
MFCTRHWKKALFLCGLLWPPGIAMSHDLEGIFVEQSSLDAETLKTLEEISSYRKEFAAQAAGQEGGDELEGFVQEAFLWPNDTISVCFFDGAPEAHEQVVSLANLWTQGTSVRFAFGPEGARNRCDGRTRTDIRVSFRGRGYWSYVGVSAKYVKPQKQTLNLSGMGDGRPLTDGQKGTVLHEFGHALGLEHEHQSPVANCEAEFDWNYLYSSFGWSKEQVDRNMRKLLINQSRSGLILTEFDTQSIMLYSLPVEAFKLGQASSCYISRKNNTLSEADLFTIQEAYPTGAMQPPAQAPEARSGVQAAIQKLIAEAGKE